ncbi:MAG: T9SS type A sorting domain-containing protein [Bacteroidetes bacterium]|nr:T9SS type A sorting domain-containing protein [Bacteroidota bacterium]
MKLKNFYLLFATVMFVPVSMIGQPWLKRDIPSANTPAMKPNLKEISARFDSYWKNKEVSVNEEENAEEGGYQQFKRWEWFMKQRTYPSGNFFDSRILFKEYQDYKQKRMAAPANQSASTNWTLIGPLVVPASGGGAGRINVIRFMPGNPNSLCVGAASGGFWGAYDGGNTWSSNTGFLSALSIADIAIYPIDTNNIYIATGDGYGYEVGGDFWGGTYTAGVLKSTDGGATWSATGLTYTQDANDIIQRLVVKPDEPNVLLAATRSAIYRSDDSGATWTIAENGHHYDIEFNTANPDIIYATNGDGVNRSLDGGLNWTQLNTGLCNGRLSLGVTAANSDVLYIFCETSTLYRSSDGGLNFNMVGSPGNQTSFYGYYDAVLAVSPVDENTLYCGGLNVVKSTDGGNNWVDAANAGGSDYVHADNHFLDFLPGSNSTVFSGNDGGIFKTTNSGTTWTDLSNGLAIKQYYRMSSSASDPYLIYAGAQDNGSDQLSNGNWTQVYGADGMDNQVDWANDQNVYVSYQYGGLQKSTNGGLTFSDIAPSSGDWVTPFVIDPNDAQTIYGGYSDVFKSTDGGLSWNAISSGMTGNSNIIALTVAPSNSDYIYTATLGQIWRKTDGGTTWTDITSGLPTSSVGITMIAVSDSDPDLVWVSFTGYSAGEKVYASTDGGSSWTNFSGGIPNVPANCIVFQNGSQDLVYVGTDFGVFYTTGGASWQAYGSDLPNVIVSDLEIHYGASKLRAATYGRGIWEADLASSTLYALDAGLQAIVSPSASSCDSTITPVIRIFNYGQDTLVSLTIDFGVDGSLSNQYIWTGSLAHGVSSTITLPAFTVSGGAHTFTATSSNPNGQPDLFAGNDTRTSNFLINTISLPPPFAEDFESGTVNPVNFSVTDNANLFTAQPYGAFGSSNFSIRADYYSVGAGTSYLKSDMLDFTNAVPPIILSFDHAYAVYSSSYHDSLIVRMSTDCGQTFPNILYAKGDNSLATAPTSTSIYYPQSSEWVNDTINLSWLAGQSGVTIQFDFKTGYGNDLYVDNINIFDNSNSIGNTDAKFTAAVYPNPSSGEIVVTFPMMSTEKYSIQITDLSGRVMQSQSNLQGNGPQKIGMNLNTLASGVYFCTISNSNGHLFSSKVVKQ